ncbi:DUF6192 family protein, partial [Streptomyces sp. NPDC052496]|uniref:DUF6192 family protein n=1 Tax=Streptomyces sp. NPDC052496 TaxID=3154951 RepID=UPI00342138C2
LVSERIGNVTRERYEHLVAESRQNVALVARAQFAVGDAALEIEPMRPVGGSAPKATDELFTVAGSLGRFAEDIGVAVSTVEDWRWIASRWPKDRRREETVSFGIHRILASISDETERWKAIDDPPYHQRSATHRWTHDAAKRRVGQRAERPETVAEKVQVVAELTRDEEVAARAAENLLRRPETITKVSPTSRARAVHELTRDEEVATQVAGELLQRPAVARKTMRDTFPNYDLVLLAS